MAAGAATDFSVAALILTLIAVVVATVVLVFLKPARFGAKLNAGEIGSGIRNVQVGVDPSGQPVYQQHVDPMALHWSHRYSTVLATAILQGVVFVLFLAAMGTDAWSEASQDILFGVSVNYRFGVVQYRANGAGFLYSDACKGTTGKTATACGTLRAAGAFTLIFSLIALISSLVLFLKMSFLGFCNSTSFWHTWQSVLADIQLVSLGACVFIWSLSGQIPCDKLMVSGAHLGSSWGLCFVCFIFAFFFTLFYRNVIELRRNGMPLLYNAPAVPVASVLVVAQPGGPQVIQVQQPQRVVMMQQPQPQQPVYAAHAQPQLYGQPAQYGGQPAQYGQPQQPQQYQGATQQMNQYPPQQAQYPSPQAQYPSPQGQYPSPQGYPQSPPQPQQPQQPPQPMQPQQPMAYGGASAYPVGGFDANAPPPAYTSSNEAPLARPSPVHEAWQGHGSAPPSEANVQLPVTFPDVSKPSSS